MADVRVDVDLNTKGAQAEAESFKGKMTNIFGDIAKTAAGVALGVGITKVPGFLLDAAKAAAEDEAQTRRLQQTFSNYADMVGASEGTFESLNALLNERIEVGQHLAFTDDDIRNSFNSLLTATDDSTEAWKRQNAAMDLARGAGISLEQASKLLGKISAENVEVFRKMGITIGENATEADALAAVQARFGGQAEAYAKSTAGQFEQTQIRMAELKEQIGMQLLPIMTKIGTVLVEDVIPKLEQFATYFQTNISPKIKAFWEQDAKPTLEAIWKYIQEVVMPAVKENFAKFQAYWVSDIKPAFENIKAGIQEVVQFLMEHWGQIEPFVRPIFILIKTNFQIAMQGIKLLIDILSGDWKGAWNDMKGAFEIVIGAVEKIFGAFKDQFLVLIKPLKDGFLGIVSGVESAITGAINAIIGFINKAIEAYNKIPLAPNVSTIPAVGSGPKTAPSVLPVYGPAAPIYGPAPPSQNPFAGDVQQIQLVVDGAVLAQVVTNQLARAM